MGKKNVERLVCRRVLKDSKDVAEKSKPLKSIFSSTHRGTKTNSDKNPQNKNKQNPPQKTPTKKQPTKDNNNKQPQLQKEENVKVCTLGEEKVI